MPAPAPHPPASRPRWFHPLAAALLVLHVALALWAVSGKSVTTDETLHLTGGYFINRYGDYRVQPENGNLPQRLAGLPAALMVSAPSEVTSDAPWRKSESWAISQHFFFDAGIDHGPLLMAGRSLMMVFSVGTGLLVLAWATRLFGPAAGLLALALYALDPNVLAHAPLATSDSAAVFCLLASVTAFWRLLESPGWGRGVLSAATVGLAGVAKFSAVLLGPVFVLLVGWRFAAAAADERRGLLRRLPGLVLGQVAGALAVIWIFHGLRYSAFAPGLRAEHFIVPWERALALIGWQGGVVAALRTVHALPEAFLYGYTWVLVSAQQRAAFLAGEYSTTGWLAFFPLAFWWKSTLALLAGLVAAAWLWARRTFTLREVAAGLTRIAPLAALFAVYGAVTLTSHLNIGHRHILPLYPILYILVGALAGPLLAAGRWRTAVLVLLLAGQAVANARVAPHYLAFFNTLAGGPANGWRLLVDSSLDWGQDLPGLQRWLERDNPAPRQERVFLAYFGMGSPAYYGIEAARLPDFPRPHDFAPWYEPTGGLYCISATLLQQVYSPAAGDWTLALEKEYQEGRLKEPRFREYWRNPAIRRELIDAGTAVAFELQWHRYDQLRFARLCHYLRARGPDAMIGYSILVFRLSEADIAAALRTPYSQWLASVEQAGVRR